MGFPQNSENSRKSKRLTCKITFCMVPLFAAALIEEIDRTWLRFAPSPAYDRRGRIVG